MELTITTDQKELYEQLKNNLPSGIELISSPPSVYRTDDISIPVTNNFDITFVIDLGKIAPYIFAAFVVKHMKSININFGVDITINSKRKKISVDDPNAVELVQEIIDNEKNDQKEID